MVLTSFFSFYFRLTAFFLLFFQTRLLPPGFFFASPFFSFCTAASGSSLAYCRFFFLFYYWLWLDLFRLLLSLAYYGVFFLHVLVWVAPPGRCLVPCTAASITAGVSCLTASIRAQWRSLTLAPFFGTLTEPHGPFRWCLFHAE